MINVRRATHPNALFPDISFAGPNLQEQNYLQRAFKLKPKHPSQIQSSTDLTNTDLTKFHQNNEVFEGDRFS